MKRKTPGPSKAADVHTLGDAQPGDVVKIEMNPFGPGGVYRVSWVTHGTTFVREYFGGMRIGDIERRRSDEPCRLLEKQPSTGGYDAADFRGDA